METTGRFARPLSFAILTIFKDAIQETNVDELLRELIRDLNALERTTRRLLPDDGVLSGDCGKLPPPK